jgi:hypothetical protein
MVREQLQRKEAYNLVNFARHGIPNAAQSSFDSGAIVNTPVTFDQ